MCDNVVSATKIGLITIYNCAIFMLRFYLMITYMQYDIIHIYSEDP